ncbi:Abi family protein [Lamprobacter modestohalophilus]|uniref:Abi family protein n=1 Tax=Lamprobacter modestohalophilus TaxID=1064514 RepID=UPI001906F845|nr:Abi family protein [Lamprobacter modestohalophilus]
MAYSKPWQSYEEQPDLLISRGLMVTDRPKALEYLQRIGYYRLSGYWFPFRERSGLLILLDEHGRKPVKKQRKETRIALDDFRPSATFEDAVKLYVFDKKLRMLVMDALERIEIALRVDVSHTLGKLDRFAYLNPALFHSEFSEKLHNDKGVTSHHEWLGKHAQLIGRSKEEFVLHNKTKYVSPWRSGSLARYGTSERCLDYPIPESLREVFATRQPTRSRHGCRG